MLRLSATVWIDAPAAVVWERLARLEDIQLWSEAIRRASCEGPLSRGVGAEWTCEFRGNLVISERWIAWDEGRSFKYEGFGLPFVKRTTHVLSVHPEGESQALFKTEAEVEFKGGLFGRMLEPIMALTFRRMGSNSLAAFKHLVENGRSYAGKHSDLPWAAATLLTNVER
jgi:Polyketide cyclase / dehydrase and lipid transport